MKIAILGTKGIPNNYGGYEQFAEFFSVRMVERGHSVTVYNPSFHKFKGSSFNGVTIETVYSPESIIGGAANIIYDHLCLRDALKKDFDIIYEAGYHSVALSMKYYGVKKLKKPVVITNMDGLEYKRTKWNSAVQKVIEKLERVAVNNSPYLISDNLGVKKYLLNKFGADSFYIPYGADLVEHFNVEKLKKYNVEPSKYFLIVARLEPENNVEVVIRAHRQSNSPYPLIVVGNHKTEFGKYLDSTYGSDGIRFVGGLYNMEELDAIRHYASLYFHGHSVGGTNPSLLEAMACSCFIVAHNNDFNRAILEDAAYYFSNEADVVRLINDAGKLREAHYAEFTRENLDKIRSTFNWKTIVDQHEELFLKLTAENK